jgi:hypothetical protein
MLISTCSQVTRDLRNVKQQLEKGIRDVEKRISESLSLELKCMASEILDRQVRSAGRIILKVTHMEESGAGRPEFDSLQGWA